MKKQNSRSLNGKLSAIALAAFLPMLVVLIYALFSLTEATKAYSEITKSVTYANQTREFKERMDYSIYLAVIGNKEYEELGDGETTVNGIVTVDPETYINDMEQKCFELSKIATVKVNQNRASRLYNTLESLKKHVLTLKEMIQGGGNYEENMAYLDENIYMLTEVIQDVILEYIRVETGNLEDVGAALEKHNRRVYSLCIGIAIIAVLSALTLTYKALKSVTEPIQKLCNLTGKVAEGDFSVRSKSGSIHEISILSQSFNTMTEEIGNLVEDIKEKERNLHLMETQLLQEQINPHFLYNTLTMICGMAAEGNTDKIISVTGALSQIFRYSIKGSEMVTLRAEMEIVNSYLMIQEERFGDRFAVKYAFEDASYDCMIPKMVIQPLVENAIVHGLEKSMKPGELLIGAGRNPEFGYLSIWIFDTGVGMPPEKLQELRDAVKQTGTQNNRDAYTNLAHMDAENHDSIGILNVNSRMVLYYGSDYTLLIDSEEGVGTNIQLRIPYRVSETSSKEEQ